MTVLKAKHHLRPSDHQAWLGELEFNLAPEFTVDWNEKSDENLDELINQIKEGTLNVLVCNLADLSINIPDKVKIVALSPRVSEVEQIWCNSEAIDMTMDFRMKEHTKLFVQDQRQQQQILNLRPDLKIKSSRDDADAYISKDLISDGFYTKITLNPKEFIPAPGFGVAAILAHQEDIASIHKLKKLHNAETAILTNVERKVMKLNISEKLEILGIYCLKSTNNNYDVFASALCDEHLLKTRISQSTNQGLAEKVLESFYKQIQ